MLQQCSHPNVVRYFGSYQGEEYLWVCTSLFFNLPFSLHTRYIQIYLDIFITLKCLYRYLIIYYVWIKSLQLLNFNLLSSICEYLRNVFFKYIFIVDNEVI